MSSLFYVSTHHTLDRRDVQTVLRFFLHCLFACCNI